MKERWGSVAACLLLVAAALVIGMAGVARSGALWPDGPRYANGAAMIHDWLRAGDFRHPYQFAQENYRQYPGFNLPYHPPAYPFFLGSFFVLTGVSYVAARLFIALCLGLAGCCFFGLLRWGGADRVAALGCSLLVLLLPEIAKWSRDTMSEIPALVLILAASGTFLLFLDRKRPWLSWLAFGLAELAFLSRLSTAGVLPAWFLFALLRGRFRQLLSPNVVCPALLYLAANIAWVHFVAGFSRYEMIDNAAPTRVARLSWDNVVFYPRCLPMMAGWGMVTLALAGTFRTLRSGRSCSGGQFWLCWLFSYSAYQWTFAVNEQRYFLFALPAFPGLVASLFRQDCSWAPRWAPGACLVLLGLIPNAVQLCQLPGGLTGYDAVAERLALTDRPGNILLACPDDQDLIFRYRAWVPGSSRLMLRGDRTLAIRLPSYAAGSHLLSMAHGPEEVLDVLRRGRVRYLITVGPAHPQDDRTEEMVLAHETAQALSESFVLRGTFPLTIAYTEPSRHYEVLLWEFQEALPDGPCELPVIIPTAGLEIPPRMARKASRDQQDSSGQTMRSP
jgi:4-amino-4-deoxy-L-arabinose transferase-like glycosyltransferase